MSTFIQFTIMTLKVFTYFSQLVCSSFFFFFLRLLKLE